VGGSRSGYSRLENGERGNRNRNGWLAWWAWHGSLHLYLGGFSILVFKLLYQDTSVDAAEVKGNIVQGKYREAF